MTTHDYSNRYRGHDYVIVDVIDSGQKLRLMGWGSGIKRGDYIILENRQDTTRYKVESIEHKSDPRDMWSLTARFAPRKSR